MAEAMIVDEDENDDFPVKELWGLDHHFKSCLKLYISEILAAPYNNPYLGVFAYRNHPFQKVDITGIVVGMDERTKCHTYIDIERQQYGKYKLPGLLVKKLDELSVPVVYELGDCIQVCGKVKVFKNMREIVSTYTSIL
ncbi:hypothetical protein LOTGIDRAFT_159296 [Lottia gigantea]|uniref:CST complex subunit Stn1 N-terminal domain-containing protein n=1 Tax=Lottia gigantea TaxID=225164 RepID=V4AJI6_LOTGI|nr:hypothetical protein LOTGIDRAFT_159296 [Lottia gigantea]ESO97277.1 hypothetical protein LOTGIDRAFT_159296 [Lottia gigantea]